MRQESPTVVSAYQSLDAVVEELAAVKAAFRQLTVEHNTALRRVTDAEAVRDNIFPLLRAAEEKNAAYARELEVLAEADIRCEELREELAHARNEGFDAGYQQAKDEEWQLPRKRRGEAS